MEFLEKRIPQAVLFIFPGELRLQDLKSSLSYSAHEDWDMLPLQSCSLPKAIGNLRLRVQPGPLCLFPPFFSLGHMAFAIQGLFFFFFLFHGNLNFNN